MDALRWMGAVRMRVRTADKNITIIHTPLQSSPSINVVWSAKLRVWDFNFKTWHLGKIWVHCNASLCNKVHVPLSSPIKIHQQICLKLFWTLFACKQCLICAYLFLLIQTRLLFHWSNQYYGQSTCIYIHAFSRRFYPKRLTIAFRLYIFNQYVCSLGIEPTTFCAADAMVYHWATQDHFSWKQLLEMKNILYIMQLFTRHWWTGVVWIIAMFLSAVWTLILTAPIHHRGAIGEQVMQCYISPNLMKKQTHQHRAWPECE